MGGAGSGLQWNADNDAPEVLSKSINKLPGQKEVTHAGAPLIFGAFQGHPLYVTPCHVHELLQSEFLHFCSAIIIRRPC